MGTIRLRDDQPLDLALTLSCGQAFRWEERGGWWEGVVGGALWKLRQDGNRLSYDGAPAGAVRRYLALDEDLPAILPSFDRDPVIHRSIGACRGLRILRQDPWEILVSFICATNTNIPRIRRMIATLSLCFGERIPGSHQEPGMSRGERGPSGQIPGSRRETRLPGSRGCPGGLGPLGTKPGASRGERGSSGQVPGASDRYAFPEPGALAAPSCKHLEPCRLGYRDRYIAETAGMVVAEPGVLERIGRLPFPEARSALLSFPGVGPKAADCILLFGYHRLGSFPVDVWIRRIMYTHYLHPLPGSKVPSEREDRRIREFGREYFGEYAGYAQEYLFCAREQLGEEPLRSPGSSSSGTLPAPR